MGVYVCVCVFVTMQLLCRVVFAWKIVCPPQRTFEKCIYAVARCAIETKEEERLVGAQTHFHSHLPQPMEPSLTAWKTLGFLLDGQVSQS